MEPNSAPLRIRTWPWQLRREFITRPILAFWSSAELRRTKPFFWRRNRARRTKLKLASAIKRENSPKRLKSRLRAIEAAGLEERMVNFIGQTLNILGRPDQALKWCALPSRTARTPGEMDRLVGDCWVMLGDDEQAVQAYKRALEYRPDFSEGVGGISHVRLLQGDFAGAREILRSGPWNRNEPAETDQIAAQIEFFARDFQAAEQLYRNLTKGNADGGGAFYGAVTHIRQPLGRSDKLGDNKGARALLEVCLKKETAALDRAPDNPEAAYRLAAVEASLDMPEAALGHLRRAVTSGWIDYRSLNLDPRFDSLRGNPAFQTIVSDLSAKVADMRSKARKQQLTLKKE